MIFRRRKYFFVLPKQSIECFRHIIEIIGFARLVEVIAVTRVSVQGVESLWGDCMFIPADWGS